MNMTEQASMHAGNMAHAAGFTVHIGLEIAGALIGIVLIFLLLRVSRESGGVLGSAVNFLTIGIVLFTISLISAAVMDGFRLTSSMETSMTIHMGLMVVALIIILIAALRITKLVK